jgi:hypothetical protein
VGDTAQAMRQSCYGAAAHSGPSGGHHCGRGSPRYAPRSQLRLTAQLSGNELRAFDPCYPRPRSHFNHRKRPGAAKSRNARPAGGVPGRPICCRGTRGGVRLLELWHDDKAPAVRSPVSWRTATGFRQLFWRYPTARIAVFLVVPSMNSECQIRRHTAERSPLGSGQFQRRRHAQSEPTIGRRRSLEHETASSAETEWLSEARFNANTANRRGARQIMMWLCSRCSLAVHPRCRDVGGAFLVVTRRPFPWPEPVPLIKTCPEIRLEAQSLRPSGRARLASPISRGTVGTGAPG